MVDHIILVSINDRSDQNSVDFVGGVTMQEALLTEEQKIRGLIVL
jgi:hypothetical protein